MTEQHTIELTEAELDELSQFLFWIDHRRVEGVPWWPGEPTEIEFGSGSLGAAVMKVHAAYNVMKGDPEVGHGC